MSRDVAKSEAVIKAVSVSEDTEADGHMSPHRMTLAPISMREGRGMVVAQGKATVGRGILVGAMVRS